VTAPNSIVTHKNAAFLMVQIIFRVPALTLQVHVHATRGSLHDRFHRSNSSDLTISGTTTYVDRAIGSLALDLGQNAVSDVTVVATDGVGSDAVRIHVVQINFIGHQLIGAGPTRRLG
jgi:hypothetical protein